MKTSGVALSGIGALTLQPELIAIGTEIYEIGERMDEMGLGIKTIREFI